jgi:predicted RNase H-like nuclease (RuvC/YqgF family)
MSAENGNENVIPFPSESQRIEIKIQELLEKRTSLNKQVEQNEEIMEQLTLKINNISDQNKKKILKKEYRELNAKTFLLLQDMLDIEDSVENLLTY